MNLNELFSPLFLDLAYRKTRDVVASEAGITAAVVATIDGFAVAHALDHQGDAARVAALASTISSIGNVATQEAGLGACGSVILNTERGFVFVRQFRHAGMDLVLIAVAGESAVLAQVMYQANRLVNEMAQA